MKKFLNSLCVGALSLSMAAVSIVPGSAMPSAPAPTTVQQDSLVTQVQLTPREERRLRRLKQRDRQMDRRNDRVERRIDRLERRADNNYYYRGYRGYRSARPGYRYYNGYYFPAGAFIAGALITGAIANSQPRVVVRRSSGHTEWCYNRYRSYRASDNTYQPLSGPRQQCYSPYN